MVNLFSEHIPAALAGIAALGGAALTWLALRYRYARRLEAIQNHERERYRELTLKHREVVGELNDCREQRAARHQELLEVQERLLEETEKRAAHAQQAARIPSLEVQLEQRRQDKQQLLEEVSRLKEENASLHTMLEKERDSARDKIRAITAVGDEFKQAFQNLANEALRHNNQMFLDLAKTSFERFHHHARTDLDERRQAVQQLVSPLGETLHKFEQELKDIERRRQHAYARLVAQTENLGAAHDRLLAETAKLVKALSQPQIRGRWGEMTLKRVVELAGMTEHCDFQLQASVGEDKRLRPDLTILLPGSRTVVVDAKAPLAAYMKAMESSEEEERAQWLRDHGRAIRNHIQQLATKKYWTQFRASPEFVVLFLPGESFFSAAVEQDPQLIEEGVRHRVILATPTTLIALLKAVAYGWQQHRMTENAMQISELGKELYRRLKRMTKTFQDLGTQLKKTVDQYNRTLGTMESRVLVSARRLSELGGSMDQHMAAPPPLDVQPRSPATATLDRDENDPHQARGKKE